MDLPPLLPFDHSIISTYHTHVSAIPQSKRNLQQNHTNGQRPKELVIKSKAIQINSTPKLKINQKLLEDDRGSPELPSLQIAYSSLQIQFQHLQSMLIKSDNLCEDQSREIRVLRNEVNRLSSLEQASKLEAEFIQNSKFMALVLENKALKIYTRDLVQQNEILTAQASLLSQCAATERLATLEDKRLPQDVDGIRKAEEWMSNSTPSPPILPNSSPCEHNSSNHNRSNVGLAETQDIFKTTEYSNALQSADSMISLHEEFGPNSPFLNTSSDMLVHSEKWESTITKPFQFKASTISKLPGGTSTCTETDTSICDKADGTPFWRPNFKNDDIDAFGSPSPTKSMLVLERDGLEMELLAQYGRIRDMMDESSLPK